MTDQRFKTMRHIETVRNCLNACVKALLHRAEQHDQSKLQNPEREMFDKWTEKLRGSTYGSPEYKAMTIEMRKEALQHHYDNNRHHPEFHKNGINDMNLIDIVEMFCDWYAAGKRHADGDIYKSIAVQTEKLNLDPMMVKILQNTADWIRSAEIFHHAEES